MPDTIYTHSVWRVKPGHESDFVAAWKELGAIFRQLPSPPDGKGTLIQSLSNPSLFCSFGAWPSLEAVESMRQNAQAQAGINRLRELCTEATPGGFKMVAQA